MRSSPRRFAQPVAGDRHRDVTATGPILSGNELPTHDHRRLPRRATAASHSPDHSGQARQRDANESRRTDVSVDRPGDRADGRRPFGCASRKRDVRRRRPALDARGTVGGEGAARVDDAHHAAVHRPWQPADDRRGRAGQDDRRDFVYVERQQTSIDRRRTRASVDHQPSLRSSADDHRDANPDVTDRKLPISRRPADDGAARHNNATDHEDNGKHDREYTHRHRPRYQPAAVPAMSHNDKHDDDRHHDNSTGAAPAVGPAQGRPRHARKTAGDEDQPRARQPGRARNPLRDRRR